MQHKVGGPVKEKTEICEYCAKLFRTKSALASHLKTHSKSQAKEAKPGVKCTVCNVWIYGIFRQHMEMHTDPVKCEKCDLMFSNKRKLLSHKRQFHLDKKYKCHLCSKAFSRKYEMEVTTIFNS